MDVFLVDGAQEKEPLEKECIAKEVAAEAGELVWLVPEVEGKVSPLQPLV